MTTFILITLALLAVAGTAVVLTRAPQQQALVAGLYGLLLTVLFFAFQAPDVALSQLVVGTIGVPMLILFTLAKIRGGRQ